MSTLNHFLSRRDFAKKSFMGVTAMMTASNVKHVFAKNSYPIRLGGPVFEKYDSPEEWVNAVKALGYSSAYCPVNAETPDNEIRAYEMAANKAGIIIAEVGVWNNPISRNKEERKKAIDKCCRQLELADKIGARCCVNISGSRGEQWDGPDADNLTQETFELIVETTRTIIDRVKPKRTFYTLEPMPWVYPDSPDSYLKLINAIDRKQFAAHLDPVNMINSPRRFYHNAEFIKECFKKLGPYIKSCHAKDIKLQNKLTTHLDEVIAGQGGLDYATFLTELSRLEGVPLMLEHLKTVEEYNRAAAYIRSVAQKMDLQCS